MRKVSIFIVIIALAFMFVRAAVAGKETHLDRTKVQGGCGACHKGHGKRATTMLNQQRDELCFSCHGLGKNLSKKTGIDIYSVILKNSHHPLIQTARYHQPGERMPESSGGALRHVACFDCHNVHKSEQGITMKGLKGYSGRGALVRQVTHEYEICYKCHADQGNPSLEQGNVAFEFAPTNASFHPVERFGKNSFVPSLKSGYTRSSIITCSDCHGNDDPTGPKGPHGSIYEPILKYRYVRTRGPESSNAYELCYPCHNRNSIISDESFRAHKIHVVYNQIACAQCHDAHGSRSNAALINFDQSVVFPNTRGQLSYLPALRGSPRCFLSCHINGRDYEHKLNQTLTYCVNMLCLPQW